MAVRSLVSWIVLSLTLESVFSNNNNNNTDGGSNILVDTSLGTLKGLKEVVDFDFSYYAFKGIKYAKAPVDELRFQPPVPVEKWEGVQDATEDGHLCAQFDIARNQPVGDEDCLSLNVYTRSVAGSKPVMVYFHGGGFIIGGGVSYFFGPKLLVEQDIVLVTVQFRLGALGYLSTGNQKAAGNWALWDQIAALKWVQENIGAFGGDAKSVTLFGEDSGAASATMLALSPKADGLFHKIIALSGNALCPQYIQHSPMESASALADRLKCENTDSADAVVECLKKQTVQDIVSAANAMYTFFSFPRWFAPVVDGTILPGNAEDLLIKGAFHRVPVVVGHTKDEGAFFYRLTLNTLNSGVYDDSFVDEHLPRLLPVLSEVDRKLLQVSKAIRKKYFRNVDLEQEDQFRPKYVEFLTDLLYTRCTDRYSRLLANQSVPTYRYLFEYRGQYSIVNLQGEDVDFGVAHGDDLQYVFSDLWGDELPMSAADIKFSKNVFVPLLVNFAKTGIPTPSITENIPTAWPPLSSSKPRLFRIGSTLSLDSEYRSDASRFWNEEIPALLSAGKKGAAARVQAAVTKDEL